MLRHRSLRGWVRQRMFERGAAGPARTSLRPGARAGRPRGSWSRQRRSGRSWSRRRLSGDQNPAAAFSRSGASAPTQRLDSPFCTKRALRSRIASCLSAALAKARSRSPASGPARRADRVQRIAARTWLPRSAVTTVPAPGHPPGTDAIGRLAPARAGSRPEIRSPRSRIEPAGPATADGARIRRARGPGRGEDRAAVDVAGQHRLDDGRRLDRREDGRPQRRPGYRRRQLMRNSRRERGVGRRVRFRRQQQAVVPQDRAGFLELGPADRADPCFEPGCIDGSRLERARPVSTLDAPVGRAAATLPSGRGPGPSPPARRAPAARSAGPSPARPRSGRPAQPPRASTMAPSRPRPGST